MIGKAVTRESTSMDDALTRTGHTGNRASHKLDRIYYNALPQRKFMCNSSEKQLCRLCVCCTKWLL